MLIIGDIAGQYDALMRLIAEAKKTCDENHIDFGEIISVGDMVDRGPDSMKVLEFFFNNQDTTKAIMGNHEHMMIEFIDDGGEYQKDLWLYNGGITTIQSFYGIQNIKPEHLRSFKKDFKKNTEMYKWLKNLPLFINEPFWDTNLFITHAPNNSKTIEMFSKKKPIDATWNRNFPKKIEGVFNVFGHNSFWGYKEFNDTENTYAICIDTSADQKLTGYIPELKKTVCVEY